MNLASHNVPLQVLQGTKTPRPGEGGTNALDGLSPKALATRRIMHLAKHCGYGNGNVHVAVDLACMQANAGCRVTFISGGGTFVPLLAQHGVEHIAMEQDHRHPHSMAGAALRLARIVRRLKPDVLHAHMMGSAVIGWAASLCSGVPLITTVHNSFDRHSRLMRLGRRVVAVSEAERVDLIRQGYAANSLDVVLNAPVGSPREMFMTNATDLEVRSPSIVTICGLHRRKGVFDLLDACAIAFGQISRWRLYVAGEGPDRQALEQHALSLGISDRVHFLGFVPSPRVLLEGADIFTLCSYADPCSLVIGEARGAGCAIVATQVGGTPEMLEFGRAGRLVPPGRPVELAKALCDLMKDPTARTRLREASRCGSEFFRVERLTRDYDRIYQKALPRTRM